MIYVEKILFYHNFLKPISCRIWHLGSLWTATENLWPNMTGKNHTRALQDRTIVGQNQNQLYSPCLHTKGICFPCLLPLYKLQTIQYTDNIMNWYSQNQQCTNGTLTDWYNKGHNIERQQSLLLKKSRGNPLRRWFYHPRQLRCEFTENDRLRNPMYPSFRKKQVYPQRSWRMNT